MLYAAASAFFFSFMGLLVKVAAVTLPWQEIVLARGVVTLALSWAALRRAGVPPWGNDRPRLLWRGFFGFCALTAFYYTVAHLPLAEATVIQNSSPLFTGLLAALILRETLGWRDSLSILAGFAGVVLVVRPEFLFGGAGAGLDPFAAGVGLFAAGCSAAAYVLVRHLRRTEDPLVVVFYFSLVATIGAIPGTLLAFEMPSGMEWLVLLGVGVCTQLGQVFLTRGLHMERAGPVTAMGYLQVALAVVWGYLLFGERPDVLMLVGSVVIAAAAVVMAWRRPPPEAPQHG